MSGKPVIDVVITNHNYHRFVPAAVESVLGQRGVTTRVFLVDDASDVPLTADPDWPQDRVRLLQRTTRGGHAAALNTGLAQCSAQYVAFLDADDLWPAYRTSLLLAAIGDADIACGGQVVFDDGQDPVLDLTEEQMKALPEVIPGCLPGTVLIRRRVLDHVGPMPESGSVGDFAMWLVNARACVPPPVLVSVDRPVLLRRSHAANMTRVRTGEFANYIQTVARHRGLLPPG